MSQFNVIRCECGFSKALDEYELSKNSYTCPVCGKEFAIFWEFVIK